MSECNKCRYKDSRCYCPPDKVCMAFRKQEDKVTHTFEFKTDKDWEPGEAACWTDCPFSFLIGLGKRCICLNGNIEFPFTKMTEVE